MIAQRAMPNPYTEALDEVRAVVEQIDDREVDAACDMIASAEKVVLCGCGREGLQLRGFCMRLFHMGRNAAMAGDMTAPPIGPGDLLIACAGPGFLSTVAALMEVARDADAKVLLLTAQAQAPLARHADHVLLIPGQTMANDEATACKVLPMGSALEGALFVLFEVMIFKLRRMLNVTADAMRANHTNLE